MTQDRDAIVSRLILFGKKDAAQQRLLLQNREEACGHVETSDYLQAVSACEIEAPRSERPYFFEGRVLLTPIHPPIHQSWRLCSVLCPGVIHV